MISLIVNIVCSIFLVILTGNDDFKKLTFKKIEITKRGWWILTFAIILNLSSVFSYLSQLQPANMEFIRTPYFTGVSDINNVGIDVPIFNSGDKKSNSIKVRFAFFSKDKQGKLAYYSINEHTPKDCAGNTTLISHFGIPRELIIQNNAEIFLYVGVEYQNGNGGFAKNHSVFKWNKFTNNMFSLVSDGMELSVIMNKMSEI